jgi:hypothetical protein
VLTDVVEAPVVAVAAPKEPLPLVMPAFEGDPSNWLVMDTVDPSLHSITGGAPDTLSVAPMYSSKAAGSAPTPPPARSGSRPVAARQVDDEDLPFIWDDPPPDDEMPSRAARSPGIAGSNEPSIADDSSQGPTPDRSHEAATGGRPGGHEYDAATNASFAAASQVDGADAPLPDWDSGPPIAASASAPSIVASPLSAPPTGFAQLDDPPSRLEWSAEYVQQAPALATPRAAGAVQAAWPEDETALQMAAVEAAAEPSSTGSALARPADAQPADPVANDEARWQSLSEQISMQVLQRVDLFTDEGLRDQLAGRLQPIMARASEELVATITGHVGQLLRTYVAEAIEREIAAWRRNQP